MILWLMNMGFAAGVVVTPPIPTPSDSGGGMAIESAHDDSGYRIRRKRIKDEDYLIITVCKIFLECK